MTTVVMKSWRHGASVGKDQIRLTLRAQTTKAENSRMVKSTLPKLKWMDDDEEQDTKP